MLCGAAKCYNVCTVLDTSFFRASSVGPGAVATPEYSSNKS